MGNTLGSKKTAKIMKINGDTIKMKTPVQAGEVVKDHPGHVLLESEAVKHFGIRAKPLESQQELKPKRLYFLVELPDVTVKTQNFAPRRIRSGINMTAKDRLESLMLSRRSASDLTIMQPTSIGLGKGESPSAMRVKMRLPKSEVSRLMMESKDGAEVAERIVELCVAGSGSGAPAKGEGSSSLDGQELRWKDGQGRVVNEGSKAREKRVGFVPMSEDEIQLAVSS
ncbi:hypothetical protein NMG60_11018843 [Bertholletia excelsa]